MIVLLGVLLWAAGDSAPQPPALAPGAAKVLHLFERLRANKHTAFHLTEEEVNQYVSEALRRQPRPGLEITQVKIYPQNYLTASTLVDFDSVEKWKPGTIPALLRPILSGKKTIWVDGRFQVQKSSVTFSVEKAYFDTLWLPAALVEQLIAIIAAEQPERYDTTKPVPLPFGLKTLATSDKQLIGRN